MPPDVASFGHLLQPRECISCPTQAPTCNCAQGFNCVLTTQSCNACSVAQCIAQASGSSGSVSTGAVAGAVIGILVFLALVIGGFWWWRRSNLRRVAPLSREKGASVVGTSSNPRSHASMALQSPFSRASAALEKGPSAPEDANPFDSDSVAGGASAHSIPIGLAPASSPSSPTRLSPTGSTFTGAPVRPPRSPDLNIRNNGVDRPAANGLLEPPRPNYAPSQRSELTVSTMDSTASSAMEGLYESPTIVSSVQRTVFGAGRAEAVPVTGLGPPSASRSQMATSMALRRSQPGPSPLASSHVVKALPTMAEEDPFADATSMRSQSTMASSKMSFGMGTPTASLRSIVPATANRVNISSLARSATLRSLGAKSAGKSSIKSGVDIPSSGDSMIGYPPTRRSSIDSFMSNTDSVLASFPFVPPSPLPTSSGRSPLSVVLGPHDSQRQSNASSFMHSGPGPEDATAPPLPTHRDLSILRESSAGGTTDSSLPDPTRPFASSSMDQRASTMSAASSGLGDFDFQFAPSSVGPDGLGSSPGGSPVSHEPVRVDSNALPPSDWPRTSAGAPPPVPAFQPKYESPDDDAASHASLDLLALSRDLAANKLAYD